MNESTAQLRERLEQEAVAWYVRLASGEMTIEEQSQFAAWRQLSTSHAKADRKIAKLWDMLDVVMVQPVDRSNQQHCQQSVMTEMNGGQNAIDSSNIISLDAERQKLSNSSKVVLHSCRTKFSLFVRWGLGFATAASVLVVLGVTLCNSGICLDNLYHPMADYHTMTGEQKTIHLADGSTIYLNTETSLDVELSEHERRIVLIQGEAEFQVAHDKTKPFIVIAGSTTTKAVGTQFIVRYQDSKGLITLLEGKILTSTNSGTGNVTLKPRNQVAFNAQQLGEVQVTDPVVAEAWRKGKLVMNFVSLQDVVNEINRYRHGHVHILNSELSKRKIHVAIDINHIDDWLSALDDTLPVRVLRFGPVVLLQATL
jgi:transmembrane sensor